MINDKTVTEWVENYQRAWRTNATTDIAALFSDDAEYHESPYETHLLSRDAIVDGWQARWDWQQGGWEFEWKLESIDGNRAHITGVGHYAVLGDFDNDWTVTFGDDGLCTRFVMINTEQD